MTIKKQDALEFVKSLPGGWDCIIYDPPYYDLKMKIERKQVRNIFEYKLNKERTFIDDEYLNILQESILKKINKNGCCILKWYNKPFSDSDYVVNWYKGNKNGFMGGYIKKNTEYVNIYFIGDRNINKDIILTETEFYPVKLTFHDNRKPFEKPVLLTKKILEWCNAKHVLDCFAGSYNSVKVAKRLNIEIDACDKYLDPPKFKETNLLKIL